MLLYVSDRERESEKETFQRRRIYQTHRKKNNTSESCIEIQQQQRKHYNVEILSEIICHSDIDLMKQNKLNL